VHDEFCGSVAEHVVVRLKSPVAAAIDIPLIAPLFAVSVTTWPALVLLSAWLLKVNELGDNPMDAGSTPVPLRATPCGLPVPEDETVTAPDRVPPAVGVNATFTVQVLPCARVDGHVFVWLKSPLAETEMPVIDPLFAVIVSACDVLVVPVVWAPNSSAFVERPSDGWAPVPLRLMLCGLPEPDDVTLITPLRAPVAVGVKVTVIVHELFCVRVPLQFVVRLKSPLATETAMLLMLPPLAVTVTVCDALDVAGAWLGKLSEVVENPRDEETTPVPLKPIAWGLPEPDELTIIVPVRDPVEIGLKVTEIVQELFGWNHRLLYLLRYR
jgi:hypothetical protein